MNAAIRRAGREGQRNINAVAATTGAPVSGYYSLGQNIVFETADGLLRALQFVLARASTFKNRIAHPTEDG